MNNLEKQFETDLKGVFKEGGYWGDAFYSYNEPWNEERNLQKQKFLEKWDEIENLENIGYDSYGSEDSTLGYVFQHKESERYIKVLGKRQSYVGEEWDSIQEVFPQTKTIVDYVHKL